VLVVGGWTFFLTPFIGAAYLLWTAGLLFSLFDFFRAIATLSNAENRRGTGIILPLLTVLIALGAWAVVVNFGIQFKRSLDKRAQYELEHWDELHGKNESQPSARGDGIPTPQP